MREVRAQAAGLEAARETLEQAALLIDGRRYEEAKQAFERAKKRLQELAALHPELADGAEASDRPFHTVARAGSERKAALGALLAELEAQRAALETRVTDEHPEHIGLTRRIEEVRRLLAALGDEDVADGSTLIVDEDGRYVLVGKEGRPVHGASRHG